LADCRLADGFQFGREKFVVQVDLQRVNLNVRLAGFGRSRQRRDLKRRLDGWQLRRRFFGASVGPWGGDFGSGGGSLSGMTATRPSSGRSGRQADGGVLRPLVRPAALGTRDRPATS